MSIRKKLPEQETLKRLLRYDPESGVLYWKRRSPDEFHQGLKFSAESNCARWNTRFAERPAFTAVERRRGQAKGHQVGIMHNVRYKAHRIIWKLIYGSDPDYIDHIDGDPQNNALKNLRSVSHQENMRNQKLRNTNTSGVNGVHWDNTRSKWVARVREGESVIMLGRFDDFEEACTAREKHDLANGFHKNHGGIRS